MTKTKLRIHTWPEKILRKKCRPVTSVDETVRSTLDEMYSFMMVNKGVGLAANQVGIDLSMVVVDAKDEVFKLVNPRIVKKKGYYIFREGCLSFPGLELEVRRADKVWISALNHKGRPVDIEAEGPLAVVFQHEIDHINGIVFIDRIPVFKKVASYRQLRNISLHTKKQLPASK